MMTSENPLVRTSSLPKLNSPRPSTPLKSSLAKLQPVLPDIVSPSMPKKSTVKKRVRFASKLERIHEDTSAVILSREKTFKTTKPIHETWSEDDPLYGAYVAYLESRHALTTETSENKRRSLSLTPQFFIPSRSPELSTDISRVPTPLQHLPRLIHRTTSTRRSIPPMVDSDSKQSVYGSISTRQIQPRRLTNSVTTMYPVIKRTDTNLPFIKPSQTNEKVIRADHSLGTKIVNEHGYTKKFTEIITNPVPGIHTQLNHVNGHVILPSFSKTPRISWHNQRSYFRNYDQNHYQPVIHSTHFNN